MGNIKRIIEVNFPLRQVSEASSREKESRMGHIPRLHIYPAARPVCASRACLLASLIPEPTSENCPKEFISDAEKILVNFSEDVMKNIDTMEVLSGEMWSHVTKVSRNGKVGNAKDLSEMLQCPAPGKLE